MKRVLLSPLVFGLMAVPPAGAEITAAPQAKKVTEWSCDVKLTLGATETFKATYSERPGDRPTLEGGDIDSGTLVGNTWEFEMRGGSAEGKGGTLKDGRLEIKGTHVNGQARVGPAPESARRPFTLTAACKVK